MKIDFKKPRVVVLGGGACGMTAAWELALAGATVTVVEREERLGGLCATHELDGYRFDLGGHRFISKSGELVERVRGLLGEELLERQRRSAILHRGRRFAYPLDALDLWRNLELAEVARAALSYARARLEARLRPGPEVSFEDWVVARFGRHLYDRFFGPYTAKLWGLPPSRLSADWAAERIAGLDLGGAALRLLGLGGGRPRSYARGYFYPRLGIGQIFESMGAQVRRLGGQILLGHALADLVRDQKGRLAAVRVVDERGRPIELLCDYVVSTVSLPLVARLAWPGEAALHAHGAALRYRAVRFLNLLLDLPEVTPNTWLYVSEPDCLPTRIQEPRHRSPAMAPPGRSSLMLEIPCDRGGEIARLDDQALLARARRDLERLGLGFVLPAVRGLFSTFVDEGYPIYDLGYAAHQRALLGAVATVDNLLSVGRQGTFRYVFMDIAMEMGLVAARQILRRSPSQRVFTDFRSDQSLLEAQATTA